MLQKFKLSDESFVNLKKNLTKFTQPTNDKLAGNIAKEYLIPDCIPIIAPSILLQITKNEVFKKYIEKSSFMHSSEPKNIYIHDLWVNFQGKHEFNPIHEHSGLLSFIVFVSIPYFAAQQKEISPGKHSNADRAGMLDFILPNSLQSTCETFKVDKTWEQYGLVFPSNTMHCVYPFYGFDEYRITLAGNIRFDN